MLHRNGEMDQQGPKKEHGKAEGIRSPAWASKNREQENNTKQPSSGPRQERLRKLPFLGALLRSIIPTGSVFSFERTFFLCLYCWDEN
jgi:hypothetical protein